MTETEYKVLNAAVEQGTFSLPPTNTRETLETLAILLARGLVSTRPEGRGEWSWTVTAAGHLAHRRYVPAPSGGGEEGK